MNTALSRLNLLTAHSISVLSVLTSLCVVSVLFSTASPEVSVFVRSVKLRNMQEYPSSPKFDFALVKFDLDADFSALFNWNSKLVFLYLLAEYKTDTHVDNQVVIWDKVLRRGENPRVVLSNAEMKYGFFDYGSGLKGNTNVTFSLHYNVIPIAGFLFRFGSGHVHVPFPAQYM